MQLSIMRSSKGILFTVKTHEAIENFFKGGNQAAVGLYGRSWEPASANEHLLCWTDPVPIRGIVRVPNNVISYRLDHVGKPILENGEDEGSLSVETVNISFLRLVGISQGTGVRFIVREVMTPQALKELAESIKNAIKHFYITYMRPIDIVVNMSTQYTYLKEKEASGELDNR